MKLFLLAFAVSFAGTEAFAPPVCAPPRFSPLQAVSGHDVRAARTSFAPGQFTTHGERGDAGRTAVAGHEIHAARPKFAPGEIPTMGGRGDAGRTQITGHEIHAARPKFAPGEIPTVGGQGGAAAGRTQIVGHEIHAARATFAPGQIPTLSSEPSAFVPHSSTGAGDHDLPEEPVRAASYALGGWKK